MKRKATEIADYMRVDNDAVEICTEIEKEARTSNEPLMMLIIKAYCAGKIEGKRAEL